MPTPALRTLILYSATLPPEIISLIRAILAEELPGSQPAAEMSVGKDEKSWTTILKFLADKQLPLLLLTVGGIDPLGVVPDATRAVCFKLFPGFGTIFRQVNQKPEFPGALLWRNTAGLRHQTLIVNLPDSAEAIRKGLPLLFPAIPNAVRLAGNVIAD